MTSVNKNRPLDLSRAVFLGILVLKSSKLNRPQEIQLDIGALLKTIHHIGGIVFQEIRNRLL